MHPVLIKRNINHNVTVSRRWQELSVASAAKISNIGMKEMIHRDSVRKVEIPSRFPTSRNRVSRHSREFRASLCIRVPFPFSTRYAASVVFLEFFNVQSRSTRYVASAQFFSLGLHGESLSRLSMGREKKKKKERKERLCPSDAHCIDTLLCRDSSCRSRHAAGTILRGAVSE